VEPQIKEGGDPAFSFLRCLSLLLDVCDLQRFFHYIDLTNGAAKHRDIIEIPGRPCSLSPNIINFEPITFVICFLFPSRSSHFSVLRALQQVGDETLAKLKYLWLYSEENLPEKYWERFEGLKASHLKTALVWAIKDFLIFLEDFVLL